MDVNGTRFHLLLGRSDWERLAVYAPGDFTWDKKREELTLGDRVFYFTPSAGNRAVEISGRRGAASDAHGNVYWIDATGTELLVHSAGSRVTSHFWSSLGGVCERRRGHFERCAGDGTAKPLAFRGLAVTTLHYLVVGTVDPAGLLIFDLHRGGEPRQILWPVPFAPFDLAAATDGGVWILDSEHAQVWRLDRAFAVVRLGGSSLTPPPDIFQSLDGSASPHGPQPEEIASDMAATLVVTKAVAVDAIDEHNVFVLDSPPNAQYSRVLRLRDGVQLAEASTQVAELLVEESKRADFQLRGHDLVVIDKTLYVAGSDGDQSIAFEFDLSNDGLVLKALAEFLPMRLFGAKALIAGVDGALYDSQDRWVPLVAQRRLRFAAQGTLIIPKLDGKEPDCVWHRLMLDACIPPDCDVIVRTRAANDEQTLDLAEWTSEPRLLRRVTGSELAWSDDTRGAGIETWELLFQRAKGRYLQLELTFRGTERSSPRVRALRAWYPRFSYLEHYLPAVYRENAESASFLDRFLANIEGFFTNVEERIAAAQCLLDYRCAPNETLDWLASWFEVALDPAWDEEKRRLFIRFAAHFFEWRGTVPGLLMALRLVSDECADESIFDVGQARTGRTAGATQKRISGPRIVEKFRTRSVPAVLYGDTSEQTTGGLPLRLRAEKWTPILGAADLHRRWAEFVERDEHYPLRSTGPEWTEFSRTTLGFVPHATFDDTELWQTVLQRRYTSVAELSSEWGVQYRHWDEIPIFTELPTALEALRDWLHFEGLVLPARDAAHRFTVFLPQSTPGIRDREKKLDLARRVIALEKPAHTTFEVKFYWAFFRVGEARLGEDTVVDLGSRSPELLSPFVLDRNYLGSGWLGKGGCR